MKRVRLYIKPRASLDGLTIHGLDMIAACMHVWGINGEYKVTVTEGTAGEHTAKDSAHTVDHKGDEYYGFGIDVRTRDITGGSRGTKANKIAHDLRSFLGDGFDIILHTTHIHLERDKRSLDIVGTN